MTFTLATGCGRGLCRKSCSRSDHQLNVYDWLADQCFNDLFRTIEFYQELIKFLGDSFLYRRSIVNASGCLSISPM